MSGRGIANRVASACLGLLASATVAEAASLVVLKQGDNSDQILTVTRDDGSLEASITLICEAPRAEFGLVVQAATLPGRRQIRAKADGAAVALGPAGGPEGASIYLLKGKGGRSIMARLLRADTIELDWAGEPQRFRLADGASAVQRFRSICSL